MLNIYLDKGIRLFKKGKYYDAIDELDKVTDSVLKSNKISAYRYLADSYLHLGNFSNAAKNFNECISLCTKSSEYDYLDDLCLRLGNSCLKEKRNYDDVISCFKNAMDRQASKEKYSKLANQLGEIYYSRAGGYLDDGKNDLAIADLNEAIKLMSKSKTGYTKRGIAYCYKIEYSKDWVYNRRGNAYYNKGEYSKAIADYAEAIKLKPNWATYYSNIGNAYYYNGDYINAIANFNKVSELDKDVSCPISCPNLKNACDKLEATDPKFSQWAEYIKKNPNEAKGYIELGVEYSNAGLHEQAINNYNKAIKLAPDCSLAYAQKGYAYFKKAYYNDAIADLKHAIELEPDFSWAHVALGDVYNVFASTFCSDPAYLPTAREKFILSYHHYKRADEIDRSKGKENACLDEAFGRVIKNINETVQYEIRPYREKITNLQDELSQAYGTISSLRNTIASQSQSISNLQNSNSYYREQASRTPRTIVKREVVYSPVGPNYCGP